MHVGTFTSDGTLDAAVEHLDDLVDLGVTAVELLPVNAFAGRHGWGYDGVAWWAVHDAYGGPDALVRLVDAAHAKGLAVVIDAVYNHLGPDGAYLSEFGPYLTDAHTTPWGPAVNYDAPGSDEVRRYVVGSALAWLRDFHVDGLRLDAVHALVDERAVHVLEEMQVAVDALAARTGTQKFLVAESDLNDPRVVTPREAGGYGLAGQWADDLHHAVHATTSGERQGYYGDFGSLATLATALQGVFVHAGSFSTFRGRAHGRPVDRGRTSGSRFVTYTTDHDQTGNRAVGDRPSQYLSSDVLRQRAALVLCSPCTPMLFMGEEWGATTPWAFFSDHAGDLGEAVRKGRRSEFAEHGWDTDDVPDPQDEATFRASTLDMSQRDQKEHAALLRWYRDLLRLRREHVALADGRLDLVDCSYDEEQRWFVLHRAGDPTSTDHGVALALNLSDEPREVPLPAATDDVLLASSDRVRAEGTTVRLPAAGVAVVATHRR